MVDTRITDNTALDSHDKILDYDLIECLYRSQQSLVYRARSRDSSETFILKLLNPNLHSLESEARFRHEYEMLKHLNVDGVVKAHDLKEHEGTYVMVLEDFGMISLDRVIQSGILSFSDALNLSVKISEILGEVHQQGIVHRDINPSNIVLNPDTLEVKIIDFGISTQLSHDIQSFSNPNLLEGTLPYMSPEQTGRMNRAIDYRTDLYSLGMTLYELFTSKLPFESQEPMEWVHYHIAKTPLPLNELNAALPKTLSDLVLKLLEKDVTARYQSAYGLKKDLEVLKEQLKIGQFLPFSLAERDTLETLRFHQKLYGRNEDLARILDCHNRVKDGQKEVLMVKGYTGIGKSSLVQELYRPITLEEGYYVSGKYDQLQRHVPYSGLIEAFRALAKQLLAEKEEELKTWKTKLLEATGVYASLLIDFVPEIELILGPQEKTADLPPSQVKVFLHRLFQKWLTLFHDMGKEVIIFLDDLQWADVDSIGFLQSLILSPQNQSLFIIGAYRDNEVSPTHPLMVSFQEIESKGTKVQEIVLAPLQLSHIKNFLEDTIPSSGSEVAALSELLKSKTGGNPFFMRQFLKELYGKSLIQYEPQKSLWHWDVGAIQAQNITDNVVELVVREIAQLPPEAQEALKLASCIGSTFDFSTLSLVSGKSKDDLKHLLFLALQKGLIISLDQNFKLLSYKQKNWLLADSDFEFKFSHDRIQQASYSQISAELKTAYHYRIGRLLLDHSQGKSKEKRLFEITHHLNEGLGHIKSNEEILTLARLNFESGEKSQTSAAFKASYYYFEKAAKLLEAEGWQKDYEFSLTAYENVARSAYINRDFEKMHEFCDVVIENTQHNLQDQAVAQTIKIASYNVQGKAEESFQLSYAFVKALKVFLPSRFLKFFFYLNRTKIDYLLRRKRKKDLANLPVMQDKKQLAITNVLGKLMSTCYHANRNLLHIVFQTGIQFGLQHGRTRELVVFCYGYGSVLFAQGRVKTGLELLRLGESWKNLFEQEGNKIEGMPWCPMIKTFEDLTEEMRSYFQVNMQNGHYARAINACHGYAHFHFFYGKNLDELETDIENFCKTLEEVLNKSSGAGFLSLKDIMKGLTDANVKLSINEADAATTDFSWADCLYRIYVLVILGEHQAAAQLLEKMEAYEKAEEDVLEKSIFYLYASLAKISSFDELNSQQKSDVLKRISSYQKKMRAWAEVVPQNFENKIHLLEAEKARLNRNHVKAIDLYDLAIASAHKNKILNEEALANERASQFYFDWGREKVGQMYLREAHKLYNQWGAETKVRQLEEQHPHLFLETEPEPEVPAQEEAPHRGTLSSIYYTKRKKLLSLDWASVQKATEALSGEKVLGELIEKIMKIVIENAGAHKGCLLLQKNDKLYIEAEIDIENDLLDLMKSKDGTNYRGLPLSVIRYAQRTQEEVILNNAREDQQFLSDDYIKRNAPKSILCLPILNQGRFVGLLYLENNLTIKAFNKDRLEILRLLSSQAAISIENANLYTSLADNPPEAGPQIEEPAPTQAPKPPKSEYDKEFRKALVNTMRKTLELWEASTHKEKIDFAEESKIWKVHIDEGRLRSRVLDKYLDEKKLPKRPRWRDVVKSAYYALDKGNLNAEAKKTLEKSLNHLLQIIYQQKSGQ